MASNLTPLSSGEWFAEWCLTMSEMFEVSSQRLRNLPPIDFCDMSPPFVQLYNQKSVDLQSRLFRAFCEFNGFLEELNPTIIPWLPTDQTLLHNMKFHQGRYPWSFVLTYSFPQIDFFDGIPKETLQKYMGVPQTGEFLCCHHRGESFRGVFIDKISPYRFKVVNIDTSDTILVPMSSVYHLPQEVCSTHALSIHCSMLEDDAELISLLENLWTKELEYIFNRELRVHSLKVKILNTFPTTPPQYHIKLVGRKNDGREIDFSEWLTEYLIPDLKGTYHLVGSKEELIYFLKDESLYPRPISDDEKPERPHKEVQKLPMPSKFPDYSKECHQLDDRSQNLVQSQLECPQDAPGASWIDPEANFVASPENHSLPFTGCEPQVGVNKVSLPNINETVNVLIPRIDDLSFAVSPKNHSLPFRGCAPQVGVNKMSLPNINETANVLIARIDVDLSFYVLLEEKYSNWVDSKNNESYSTMMARLNNPTFTRKPLLDFPKTGDFVICKDKSGSWSRGLVMETCQPHLFIHNPDIGELNVVSEMGDLRSPEQEDKILPFQAVLSFLHGIRLVDGCEEEAQKYFASLVSSRKLHVVVKDVDLENTQMVVELFAEERVSINQNLVASGLCVVD